MNKNIKNRAGRLRTKVRRKIGEVSSRPRLTVFRSNRFLYAQVIDDTKGITLHSTHDRGLSDKKMMKRDRAAEMGKIFGQALKLKKISSVVFDRGCYQYGGRVKAFCEGVREAGITI